MDLNEIAVFIKVVQTGSFTRAARELEMPNSTVSFKVSALEKRLGVALIQRTTRRLHITPIGQSFFKRCLEGLDEIREAETEILSGQEEPSGPLKITAAVELGVALLPKIIAAYAKKYPRVSVDVTLSDRRVDLVSEGFDLALRAGELQDSSLIAKKLGSVYFAPFASPKYLKNYGSPRTALDLKDHKLIDFSQITDGSWSLVREGKTVKVSSTQKVATNDLRLASLLAIEGSGVALLPTFFCYSAVQSGQLVRVLPQWLSAKSPVQFVYPSHRFVMPKLSSFIEMAAEPIKEELLAFKI